MLLELAIGDAYGAVFEYAEAEFVRERNDGLDYPARRGRAAGEGRYTDDTQMSLAIAEAIVSGESWTRENLAERFVAVFHRDPRDGYARRFESFLEETRTGADFLARIRPESDKSGAAMRACPIGIYPTAAEVVERTTLQAKLTHDTPNGIGAAVAAALMTHYCLYELGPKAELPMLLARWVPGFHWKEPWNGHVGGQGWMSVRAALTALLSNDRMTDILRASIAYTGDVDTVATIALAAGSCSREVEQDLPMGLSDGLENGAYGRDYLINLDRRLLALVRRSEL